MSTDQKERLSALVADAIGSAVPAAVDDEARRRPAQTERWIDPIPKQLFNSRPPVIAERLDAEPHLVSHASNLAQPSKVIPIPIIPSIIPAITPIVWNRESSRLSSGLTWASNSMPRNSDEMA